MNGLAGAVKAAFGILGKENRRGALVGGLAVSAVCEPRFTRDVDLVIAVRDDASAERLVSAFVGRGFGIMTVVEQKSVRRLATVRLVPPGGSDEGMVVDLLFSSSGIEPEIVRDAVEIEVWQGVRVPVARIGHLVALKVLSRDDRTRPQDLVDLRTLLTRCSRTEMKRARAAIELISERGCDRGRDLARELDRAIAGGRNP